MKNLIVVGLDFEKQQEQTPQQSEVLTDITTTAEPECDTVNYELVAFEWVEANAVSLNERCNEAIGKGETELLLTASELPPAMSWDNVCKELVRAGLKTAECCADGIKIKLN